jgi:hypothetical protein
LKKVSDRYEFFEVHFFVEKRSLGSHFILEHKIDIIFVGPQPKN